MPQNKTRAAFVEPMLLLRTEKLPEGPDWLYELKFDGYRALAIKTGGKVHLRSRNDNDFNARYPTIVKALAAMPDETVQDVMGEPLTNRRRLLEKHVFPEMIEPIRYSPVLDGSLKDLVQSVKAQGLEGLVAKRHDSRYEAGIRSGAWQKMRVNRGQEFVIGGYTVGGATFDAMVFGYYDGEKLMYAAERAMASHRNSGPNCSGNSRRWKSWNARSPICRRRRPVAGAWG
jgi:bifunctional non-homologous end joining protein LigD